MNLETLKKAIKEACDSDKLVVKQIESLIHKHRLYLTDKYFLKICKIAGDCCGVSTREMFNKDQSLMPVLARRLVFKKMKIEQYTLIKIGKFFNTDHSTIFSGLKSFETDLKTRHEPTVKAYKMFTEKIKEYESK